MRIGGACVKQFLGLYCGLMQTGAFQKRSPEIDGETETQLYKILDSRTCKTAPVMRGLLLYLWQHRDQSPNEYAIGVDALGRPPDFNPVTDAIVRVQIGRLRAKLKEFYEERSEPFPLQLSIPVGGHQLAWTYDISHPEPRLSTELPHIPPTPRPDRKLIAGLVIGLAALAVLLVVALSEIRGLRAVAPVPASPPRFLRAFFLNGKPTMIVLPTPAFFTWPGNPDVVIRDRNVAAYQAWPESPFMRSTAKQLGPPTLFNSYVNVSLVMAGQNLSRYLEGLGQHPNITASASLAADAVNSHNLIFLGAPRDYPADDKVRQILTKTNFEPSFKMPPVMLNRHPRAGEPAAYRDLEPSVQQKLRYNLLVLPPAMRSGVRTLLVLGHAPLAYITGLRLPEALDQLEKQWLNGGSPDAWEMVVEVEMNGETVHSVTPKAFRAIDSKFSD